MNKIVCPDRLSVIELFQIFYKNKNASGKLYFDENYILTKNKTPNGTIFMGHGFNETI